MNEIANIAFISQAMNREIGKTPPAEYLDAIPRERLQQQFVPTDRTLWEIGNYQRFLSYRRELLAAGINDVVATFR